MGGTNFEYDGKAFNARVESVQAPAIPGTLRIYSAAQRLGVRVFLLTGRPEARRAFTDTNLQLRGFSAWQQLILRKPEQAKMTALEYKSGECAKIAAAGYRINPQRRRSLERSARPRILSEISRPFYSIKERRSGREMGEGKKTGEASQEVELSHRGLMAKLRSLA